LREGWFLFGELVVAELVGLFFMGRGGGVLLFYGLIGGFVSLSFIFVSDFLCIDLVCFLFF
jgi:hypothetical protein